MSKSYKLKIVLGGAANSGKSTFLNNNFIHETPIGVSFKPIECFVNDGDSYKFVCWDLKARDKYEFTYQIFSRGACGAFLCFEVSNYESFKKLPLWINVIRESAGKIPIFLIGTKIDLPREVHDDDIEKLIKKYDLEGIHFSSINQEPEKKAIVFKNLIERLDPKNYIFNFSFFIPNNITDKKFKKFLEKFSSCPICQRENHYEYLKNFYFSRDAEIIKIKDNLLALIKTLKRHRNRINIPRIGIPCCKCFKKIFKK